MNNLALISDISSLPEDLKQEVVDFVAFLKQKAEKKATPHKIKQRQFGIGKGSFVMAPDFDEPLDDFKEYM